MPQHVSHVIGFDDAPFQRSHQGNVLVVGAVYAGLCLEGILSGKVRRDGTNSTRVVAQLVMQSRFSEHVQLIMLQGIALAGFNVIDINRLHNMLNRSILVIARRLPNLSAIKDALLSHVPGGERKWELITQAGPMEQVANLYVQRVGISISETKEIIKRLSVHSAVPEPLRTAHLIAGGIATGQSKGRV
jgi:hypothetical protein